MIPFGCCCLVAFFSFPFLFRSAVLLLSGGGIQAYSMLTAGDGTAGLRLPQLSFAPPHNCVARQCALVLLISAHVILAKEGWTAKGQASGHPSCVGQHQA